jgi:hypothetical protein
MITTVKIICRPMPDQSMWQRSKREMTRHAESFGGTVTIEEGREVVVAVEFEDAVKAGEFATWWAEKTGKNN